MILLEIQLKIKVSHFNILTFLDLELFLDEANDLDDQADDDESNAN